MASLRVRDHLGAFVRDESGTSAVEYALIAAGLSIAIAGVAFEIGRALESDFQAVNDGFN